MTLQKELDRVVGKYLPQYRVAIAGFLGGTPRREAIELFASNPCLGLMLTFCAEFVHAGEEPWDEARRWVTRSRHEILAWLGFPATRSAVGIAARIDMRRTSLDQCRLLRRALRDSDASKFLRHCPVLCGAVLDALTRSELEEYMTPDLLEDLCHNPDADDVVQEMMLLVGLVRRDDLRFRPFRSCEQVFEMRDLTLDLEVSRFPEWNPDCERIDFPEAPVSVPAYTQPRGLRIEPIWSPRDLFLEAIEQHNCVFERVYDIAAGKVAIYRALAPERLTVMLEPGEDGFWRLTQSRAIWNRKPSRDSVLAVGAYLTKRQAQQLSVDAP